MKAVVFHDVGDIRLEDVPEPKLKEPTDAIVRLTTSAICGTDLHMVRGSMPGMKEGRILGHEGVGIVEEVGKDVRNFKKGDRVVICSTIACGTCSYCRAGYFAQCDNANPGGKRAGTAFFGGPEAAGGFDGMQAEKVRVPFAHVTMVKVPDEVSDHQAILISDIFPTGYFGADLAEITNGDTVAVFGCGPVGQFAIASAKMRGATRVLAVDAIPDRLEIARRQGAECINYDEEDPIEVILRLTGGIGVDRAIDAVGVDANVPEHGPAAKKLKKQKAEFEEEVKEVAPEGKPEGVDGGHYKPGNAPSLVLTWATEALAKAGTLAVIGVYPETVKTFPIGQAMMKNLTLKMGNCNHRKYVPKLLELVRTGAFDPTLILPREEGILSSIEAYEQFDEKKPGWIKVELNPAARANGKARRGEGAPATH